MRLSHEAYWNFLFSYNCPHCKEKCMFKINDVSMDVKVSKWDKFWNNIKEGKE